MIDAIIKSRRTRTDATVQAQKKYYESHKKVIFEHCNDWKRKKWAEDADYRKLRIHQINERNKIKRAEYKDALYHIRFLFKNYRINY